MANFESTLRDFYDYPTIKKNLKINAISAGLTNAEALFEKMCGGPASLPQRSKVKDDMIHEVTSPILFSVCQLSVTDS
jgi:hypothetical protein